MKNPDNYSKTMTLHMLYRLIEFFAELSNLRMERDFLQRQLDKCTDVDRSESPEVINSPSEKVERKGK